MSLPARWTISIDFGTGLSKAAAAPRAVGDGAGLKDARPLPIGAASGAAQRWFSPSAVYLMGGRLRFGPAAIEAAERTGGGRREALQSFKTLLGAGDMSAVLETRPPLGIDPDGFFLYRELITLYLAYLLDLIEIAAADELGPDAGPRVLRYTRPGWFADRAQADHAEFVALFHHAAAIRAHLGPKFWELGLSYDDARKALAAAMDAPADMTIEGGLAEATAAALCHIPMDDDEPRRVIVLDVGSGTSDIGAFETGGPEGVREIHKARRVLGVGADAVDRVIMNMIVEKARLARDATAQAALWRRLLPVIRALKERLFIEGRASFEVGGKPLRCSLGELQRARGYRQIAGEIAAAFRQALEIAAEDAGAAGVRRIEAAAAGGGANFPFVAKLLRTARPRAKGVSAHAYPPTPAWARARDPAFGAAFPQLAVALGAAIAPERLLIR